MTKFKAGDKVYCPLLETTDIHTLVADPISDRRVCIEVFGGLQSFHNDGRHNKNTLFADLFHATPENKAALEQLYGMEFEDVK